MNDTQWLFELEAMNKEEFDGLEQKRKMADIFKRQVISMLGLNMCPIEDEVTGLLRLPNDDEVLPLAALIGRDDVLKLIDERREEFLNQERAQAQLAGECVDLHDGMSPGFHGVPHDGISMPELTPEELEEFMSDEGDVEFENTNPEVAKALNWASPLDRAVMENVVLVKDDDDSDPNTLTPNKSARTVGQLRDELRQRALDEKAESVASTFEEVDIVSDDSVKMPELDLDAAKLTVTLEEDD
jgi:hypothetical protein